MFENKITISFGNSLEEKSAMMINGKCTSRIILMQFLSAYEQYVNQILFIGEKDDTAAYLNKLCLFDLAIDFFKECKKDIMQEEMEKERGGEG